MAQSRYIYPSVRRGVPQREISAQSWRLPPVLHRTAELRWEKYRKFGTESVAGRSPSSLRHSGSCRLPAQWLRGDVARCLCYYSKVALRSTASIALNATRAIFRTLGNPCILPMRDVNGVSRKSWFGLVYVCHTPQWNKPIHGTLVRQLARGAFVMSYWSQPFVRNTMHNIVHILQTWWLVCSIRCCIRI